MRDVALLAYNSCVFPPLASQPDDHGCRAGSAQLSPDSSPRIELLKNPCRRCRVVKWAKEYCFGPYSGELPFPTKLRGGATLPLPCTCPHRVEQRRGEGNTTMRKCRNFHARLSDYREG